MYAMLHSSSHSAEAYAPRLGPSKLADMLLQCCDYDGTKRPSFDGVLAILQALLDNELKADAEGDSDPSKPEGTQITAAQLTDAYF